MSAAEPTAQQLQSVADMAAAAPAEPAAAEAAAAGGIGQQQQQLGVGHDAAAAGAAPAAGDAAGIGLNGHAADAGVEEEGGIKPLDVAGYALIDCLVAGEEGGMQQQALVEATQARLTSDTARALVTEALDEGLSFGLFVRNDQGLILLDKALAEATKETIGA